MPAMPEDVRTSDSVLSIESLPPTASTDHENQAEVSSPASPVLISSGSTPTEANVDEQFRIEVTCPGCRRGLRIRSSYLGRFVVCQHCGQRFLARTEVGRPGDGGG